MFGLTRALLATGLAPFASAQFELDPCVSNSVAFHPIGFAAYAVSVRRWQVARWARDCFSQTKRCIELASPRISMSSSS